MKIKIIVSPVRRVTEHFGYVSGIIPCLSASTISQTLYFVVSLDKPDNAISAYIFPNDARKICLYLEGLNYHPNDISDNLEMYALDDK